MFDTEFRRRIIDTFINSVYLYDDRVIVFYNIRSGKQVSYIDMLDATDGFPGLDDGPAPGDSAETTDAKKKPDTVSGVRLLNGMSFVDKKDAGPKPLRRNGFLVFQASSSELLTAFLNCTINGTDCKE